MTDLVVLPSCRAATCGDYHAETVGQLAGHLVEVHAISAGRALADARALLAAPPPAPAVPDPLPDDEGAPSMPRRGTPPPKYSRSTYACSACGGKGHTARSSQCPQARNGAGPALNKAGQPRGPLPVIGAVAALRAEIAALDAKRAKLVAALEVLEA